MKRYAMALAAMVLLGGAAPSGLGLSTDQIDDFLLTGIHSTYEPQPLVGWDAEVRKALTAKNRDAAVAAMAPRYGLSAAQMTELVRLWVRSDNVAFEFVKADAGPSAKPDLRRRLLALVTEVRTDLVVQAAAVALDRIDECQAGDFDALIAGATDRRRDAWLIANSAPCGGHFLRAARVGDTPFLPPLIRAADYGVLAPVDALALYAWLVSPEALARVAESDRDALKARVILLYAGKLFDTGQDDEAVALVDSQSAPVKALLRTGRIDAGTATIDGVPVTFAKEEGARTVMLRLAAAYALRGRRDDAVALFGQAGDRAGAERAFRCRWDYSAEGKSDTTCRDHDDRDWLGQMMLAQFLDHPDADPYPLAEAGFSSQNSGGNSIPELACRLFDRAQFPEICADEQRSIAYAAELDDDRYDAKKKEALAADLASLGLPGFAERRAAYDASLRATVERIGLDADKSSARQRTSLDPDPSPFLAQPLPDAVRTAARRASTWPKDATALPGDFMPVRFERSGMRAVAISLSQNFDPVGEVSGGGYWVHLSDDGGRRWHAPLYPGLADRFPYPVPAEARMPLLGEDGAINLEVEVALLDTASITYPPVALATRRREADLYLGLPVAELTRDSDGDGFTDIAARHLLLDRTGDAAPMLIGTRKTEGCAPMGKMQGAQVALLEKLFDVHAVPIVEPLDMTSADIGERMTKWGSATTGPARPIFLMGDPADFASLRSDQPIIVYSPAHKAALAGKSPDFHPVTMPKIVFNRAGDRGYVQWSAGWTGGTLRLRFEKNRWRIETIGSWIT
ncbi:MAG: hypothetical protein IBJ13_00050 [Sphingopyxis sp.]|nr:hypothetical protein [Sphingopyxis sp.]